MALASWKAFKFFNASEVNLHDSDGLSLFKNGEVTSTCAGTSSLFAGTSNGRVFQLSQAFKIIRAFDASEGGAPITHMTQPNGTQFMLTVAEDLSNDPVLKMWALDKPEKKTGLPQCLATVNIQNGRQQFPISAFATLDDITQLAFGFANGAVTVLRGDLIHDRGTKQRTIFESPEPITGVEFRRGNTIALYIATTGRLLTVILSGRGQGQPARTLEENGCAVGCMTVDTSTRDVILARDDAIYYYGLHGRGSCYSCDGQKTLLKSHKDYVIYACPSSSTSLSRSTLASFQPGRSGDVSQNTTFTILNTDFQFIAHTETVSSQIQRCFTVWGSLFLVTEDGRVLRYEEKPLQQRLEILFQRNLYVLAIQVAQRAGVEQTQQSAIFRRYGDYLYQKKDYDTAMQQYLRAIDTAEPSQIIRKYLGTQRIHNLIDYLEELHETQKANADHTVLLLNCYAKTKDVEKLENFIKAPGDNKFDLDTAVSMCRQGGYFDQAAFLARKHSEHAMVVTILIEDLKKYAEALAYIWRLEADLAYESLMKYATVLLYHCPAETTTLFTTYYTGQYRPKKDAVVVSQAPNPQQQTTGTTGSSFTTSAVQNLAALLPLPYMSINTRQDAKDMRVVESIDNDEQQQQQQPPSYPVPEPKTAFPAFVDHPEEFVKFLEACVTSPHITNHSEQKSAMYSTLFEMYLNRMNSPDTPAKEKAQLERKAKELVETEKVPPDAPPLLLHSTLSGYAPGTTLFREHQDLYHDIFRGYTSARDTKGALEALRKYGKKEPSLYPAALAYLTSSKDVLEEAGQREFDEILKIIDREGLMAPVGVVRMLARNEGGSGGDGRGGREAEGSSEQSNNGAATMGLLKSYLKDVVERERAEIEKNSTTTSTFLHDTHTKSTELRSLTQPQPEGAPQKTFTNTRCTSCGYALDNPVAHFWCGHSFHVRCLDIPEEDAANAGNQVSAAGVASPRGFGGDDTIATPHRQGGTRGSSAAATAEDRAKSAGIECPSCAPSNEVIRGIRRAQEGSRDKHGVFVDALGRSAGRGGGLRVVGEWMGRGVFGGEV
ncbi:MAG: hypothetical protein M1831_001508 [Alyxoria varia]|nr:MAG: hypothetical protein M1831_001508 [Alyxoria varia]